MPQIAQATNETSRLTNAQHYGALTPATSMASIALGGSGEARPVMIIRAPRLSLAGLWRAFKRLTHYRDLILTLSVHRLQVRYKQSVLGLSWAVLQPLSLMVIYTAVFSRIARVPSEGTPYALFAYSALLPWTYFSTSLSTATNSLVSHVNLVTKVYFPREILPLTYVAAALIDFLVASTVLAGMLLFYRVPLTVHALYVLPTVAILTMFAIATSLVLCVVQVRFRDIGVAMPLVLQLWMFASPVVYPLSVVPAKWQALYVLNPMVGIIESFRRVIVQGTSPEMHSLGIAAAISACFLPIAYACFKRVEATMADII
jgi:homopolymeric O-antigen transport system permease protein